MAESADYEGQHVAPKLKRDHILSNELYDILKGCSLYVFPALAAFYVTVAGIWGLPHSSEVMKTVIAVDTCIGAIIGLSKKSYNNSESKFAGDLVVKKLPDDEDDGISRVGMGLALNAPLDYKNNKEVTFKVKPID